MIKSIYLLTMTCDNGGGHVIQVGNNVSPASPYEQEFEGRSRSECLGQARHAGWRVHRGGTTTCPGCVAMAKHETEFDARVREGVLRDEAAEDDENAVLR